MGTAVGLGTTFCVFAKAFYYQDAISLMVGGTATPTARNTLPHVPSLSNLAANLFQLSSMMVS